MSLKFVDSVPSNRLYDYAAIVAELRERPGSWAEVARVPAEQFTPSKRVIVTQGFKRHGADVASRTDPATGDLVVYARTK